MLQTHIQNEAFYLGCILQDGSLIDESTLRNGHFVKREHGNLYKQFMIFKSKEEQIDVVRLSQLGRETLETFGGMTYISEITLSVPSLNAFKYYEQQIRTHYILAQARKGAHEFLSETSEEINIDYLSKLSERITKLETDFVEKKAISFSEMLTERYEYHENTLKDGLSGIDTGFDIMNQLSDGWQRSDLIVIGARPSMGKTAFILNSALRGADRDPKVMPVLFSIEMTEGKIIDRMLASISKINLMKFNNPKKYFSTDDWTRYMNALGKLGNYNFAIQTENTVPEMKSVLRQIVKQNPDKKIIVMIDFLTLIKCTSSKGSRHHEIEDIVLDLKHMAQALDIPVIVLAQLSRGVESRENKRPMMSDLRESGSIEQTADQIMLLYRDEYYNKNTDKGNATEIIIAKNRNGTTGTIELKFEKSTNTFTEVI